MSVNPSCDSKVLVRVQSVVNRPDQSVACFTDSIDLRLCRSVVVHQVVVLRKLPNVVFYRGVEFHVVVLLLVGEVLPGGHTRLSVSVSLIALCLFVD